MQVNRERNGALVVIIGAALGAGIVGSAFALWYPGALKRAGSGADAVALAYTLAAPVAAVIGAIVGAVVFRIMPLLSKTATIVLALTACAALVFAAIPYFWR